MPPKSDKDEKQPRKRQKKKEEYEDDDEDDDVEEGEIEVEIEIERETTHIGCQYAEPVDAMSDQAYNTWFTANWAVDSPLPPLLWQTRSVEHILLPQNRVFALFHTMGAGKTLTAVLAGEAYLAQTFWNATKQQPQMGRVVFISRPSLISNFVKQLKSYGRNDEHIRQYYCFFTFTTIVRRFDTFLELCKTPQTMLIVDEYHLLPAAIGKGKLRSETKPVPVAQQNIKWPTVPRDHSIKGVQAAAFLLGAQQATKILIMTGTPTVNREADMRNLGILFSGGPHPYQMKLLKATKFQYGPMRDYMHTLLQCRVSVIGLDYVRHLMPRWTETTVVLEMTPAYFQEYDIVEHSDDKEDFERFERDREGQGMFLHNVRQISSEMNGKLNPKIPYVIKILLTQPNAFPAIIATEWIGRGADVLEHELRTAHITRIAVITGKTKEIDRKRAQAAYNSGAVDVIILSRVGATGINLLRTRTLVIMTPQWNSVSREQTMFRGIRIRSHDDLPVESRHVNVYSLLLAKPTEFMKVQRKVQNDIEMKRPGASQVMQVVPYQQLEPLLEKAQRTVTMDMAMKLAQKRKLEREGLSENDEDEGEEKEEEEKYEESGADFTLYKLQIKKALITTTAMRFFESLSIEKDPQCVSINPRRVEVKSTSPPKVKAKRPSPLKSVPGRVEVKSQSPPKAKKAERTYVSISPSPPPPHPPSSSSSSKVSKAKRSRSRSIEKLIKESKEAQEPKAVKESKETWSKEALERYKHKKTVIQQQQRQPVLSHHKPFKAPVPVAPKPKPKPSVKEQPWSKQALDRHKHNNLKQQVQQFRPPPRPLPPLKRKP